MNTQAAEPTTITYNAEDANAAYEFTRVAARVGQTGVQRVEEVTRNKVIVHVLGSITFPETTQQQ